MMIDKSVCASRVTRHQADAERYGPPIPPPAPEPRAMNSLCCVRHSVSGQRQQSQGFSFPRDLYGQFRGQSPRVTIRISGTIGTKIQ